MARYICLEGTEGVGKTTQTQKLVDYLRGKGFKVLQTKEPGTPLSPVTMKLREIMLSNEFDKDLTPAARELISQAIRSIHIDKVVNPAKNEYDFIVQDRGILSGLSYGTACGNDTRLLETLAEFAVYNAYGDLGIDIYDDVLYLRGNVSQGLDRALSSKQEFKDGDAMESRGNEFLSQVGRNMDDFSKRFNTKVITVDGKSIEEVFNEMLLTLNLKD
jgi:dTMP kinase